MKHNCAEGWSKSSISDECVSPPSYRGPFQCKKNYSHQCPNNWVPEDDTNCRPLATYEGTCLLSHDFSNMTDEQKEIWSNKCATDWPCKEKCKKDYSKLCPQEWTKNSNFCDGTCSAPIKYSGPCLPRASLHTLDKDMKESFEKLCKLDFPCLKECKIDNQDPCPKNWILKSDESGNPISCLPPDNYSGPCDEHSNFTGLNIDSKESIAYECDVQWPCAEETSNLINYEELCPENWTQSQKYCVAPQNYMGPCSKKKLFESFRKETKKAYAEECNIEWPLFKKSISKNFPKSSSTKTKFQALCP
ncbi:CPW-WPC family protein [Plasmodium brasilianum]|uniref:CPW-WPC family protein n=1 Tax=Plasmodium brasilianum TaxID=5824 RepID=A0ACB9Y2X7_PLABR|nr:CPW-WPC family protein [Plasmodium brasilianum]